MHEFNDAGLLPPGIHWFELDEFIIEFGYNSHRRKLISGLEILIKDLRRAGCTLIYIDGSFVTDKELPNDYDACWDANGVNGYVISPLLLDFTPHGRILQKAYYKGDIFLANTKETKSGRVFLDFFQIDKKTGNPKGIVAIKI